MYLVICAITRNESKNITGYVERVKKFVDEIIIVDNASEDETATIAESLGCTVIRNTENTLDTARNLYLAQTVGKWVFSLDLDEEMYPSDIQKMRYLLECIDEKIGAFYLPMYQYFGNGHWATLYQCRLVKNIIGVKYERMIHGSVYKSILAAGYSISCMNTPVHHYDGLYSIERNISKRERNIQMLHNQLSEMETASLYCYLALEESAFGFDNNAITSINKAIMMDKDNHTYAYLFKSQILCNIGDYENAINNAEIQLKICEKRKNDKDPRVHFFTLMADSADIIRIKCKIAQNKISESIDIVKNSIFRYPWLAHNYINLYHLTGDFKHIETAINFNKNILNNKIYCDIMPYNLYKLQDSILDEVNLQKQLNNYNTNAKLY
jgi:glycosyltransferase involved in cell wall biosynthesis